MKKIIPYLLAALLGLSGCTIISNTDELSVLGDYSREKDNQHRLVKSINDHYDALTKTVDQKAINDYKDKASLVYSFGDPILKKDLSDGGQRWLYRYAIFRLAKDKVYVYFDRTGKLTKWEKIPCPSFF
jgi:hypothetical protein